MTSAVIPQQEGEYTPEEARAWMAAQVGEENRAGDPEVAQRVVKFVENVLSEWNDRMGGLRRRWRGTFKMLAGNTLENGGPEDVHVPEIYKAMETIIPRMEEAITEKDPWFRVVPRRAKNQAQGDTISAYMQWLYDQAKVADTIQSAARNMLITQCAAWYVYWENKEEWRNEREVIREFDKDGRLTRRVKTKRKKVVSYCGAKAVLIDTPDFIIDTKSTNPQNAVYVGHRAFMTVDEIKRIGKMAGWKNLDRVGDVDISGSSTSALTDNTTAFRDPASQTGGSMDRFRTVPGAPQKVEVVFLYSKWSLNDDDEYEDVQMIVAGGKTCLDCRPNPHDGQYRPYATARSTKSGHEFFGVGPFDNAIRLNQHLDRYHQIFLRAAEVAACPMVFAEEDSEMPDSLYKVKPFSVFKGVGAVRFTQVPDGSLRAAPLVLGTIQKNIEETVGAFRIQMGQDSGGTATEASLSLQEGNRRMRAYIRSLGDGLEQLLTIFYKLAMQYSIEDVEFPVLGKRALELRKTHMNVSPADLLDDVKFDLVGLHSLRTYGLKATGLQSFVNSMAPFIASNPQAVDQIKLMHEVARELIGPDEADQIVKVPTDIDKLKSQDEENEGLIAGEEIEVDPDDDDEDHMRNETLRAMVKRAMEKDSPMQFEVRRVVLQHYFQHQHQAQKKKAQEKAIQARMPVQQQLPPEAGGDVNPETGKSSPKAGGFSDAATTLANESTPGGQTQGENPGPADSRKYGRSGRAGRTTNQTEN